MTASSERLQEECTTLQSNGIVGFDDHHNDRLTNTVPDVREDDDGAKDNRPNEDRCPEEGPRRQEKKREDH